MSVNLRSNGTLVVKIGGGAGLDLAAVCADLARIAAEGQLVVVHGVSAIMDEMCRDRGIEVQTLTSPSGHSSRYTSPAIRDVYVEAANLANEQVVAGLSGFCLAARGLIGESVAIQARRKQAIRAVVKGRVRMVRDDHSGSIRGVDAAVLRDLLDAGETPVLPPLARSDDGLLNVDGDRAGAAVAGALAAETLVILSNVRGLYRDFPDEDSFVSQVQPGQIVEALDWAQGRMKRKVLAAQEALDSGVARVIIADGRVTDPVSKALAGSGTRFGA